MFLFKPRMTRPESDNPYYNRPPKGYAAGISIAASYSPSNLVIKPMICTLADWNVSQKYVPYCPSMQEMYQMILALQNGTRSAPALVKAEPEEIKEPETGEEEMR